MKAPKPVLFRTDASWIEILLEVVEWAKASSQHLAILLLDFEKAYDRVDWDYLEGTMLRMGFPPLWISGVAGLYKSASSAVTIGSFVGDSFHLSRSVIQSYPVAHCLFFFFFSFLKNWALAFHITFEIRCKLYGQRPMSLIRYHQR